MRQATDPVDDALQSLRGTAWPAQDPDVELENRLMNAFEENRPVARSRHRRTWMAVVAVLVVASAGFAAAGGIALLRSWLVTTEINGEVVDVREITFDENGRATLAIPIDVPPQGEIVEVGMKFEGDGSEDDAEKTLTVNVDGMETTEGVLEVEIEVEEAEEEE